MALPPYNNRTDKRERSVIVEKVRARHGRRSGRQPEPNQTQNSQGHLTRFNTTGSVLSEYEHKKMNAKDGIVRRHPLDAPMHKNSILKLVRAADNSSVEARHFWSTKGSTCKRNGFTWKRLSKLAMEVDDYEGLMFWRVVDAIIIDPRQAMFLDR